MARKATGRRRRRTPCSQARARRLLLRRPEPLLSLGAFSGCNAAEVGIRLVFLEADRNRLVASLEKRVLRRAGIQPPTPEIPQAPGLEPQGCAALELERLPGRGEIRRRRERRHLVVRARL